MKRRLQAWMERQLHPHHAVCRHCRRPWACVFPFVVYYSPSRGAFALCVRCWENATDDERMDAMRQAHGGAHDWPEIEAAILGVPERAA